MTYKIKAFSPVSFEQFCHNHELILLGRVCYMQFGGYKFAIALSQEAGEGERKRIYENYVRWWWQPVVDKETGDMLSYVGVFHDTERKESNYD